MKLGIIWFLIGLCEVISAHLFIAKKRDLFADPNTRLARLWIKPLRNAEHALHLLTAANLVDREWLVDLTVRAMTVMGVALTALGGVLLVFPWSSAGALIVSGITLVGLFIAIGIIFCHHCRVAGGRQ